MLILKQWLREIISIFVFIRFKTIDKLYKYLNENKIESGPLASSFALYLEKRGSQIGIGAEFKNWPYFPHGLYGIFISPKVKIGKNCVIFQQVTIGAARTAGSKRNGNPTIGDDCYIGAGAKIIGNITIGNNVRIGANAVVYEDIPDNSVVVSSPTRIITKKEKLDNRFYILNDDDSESYFDFETRTFKK